MHDLWVFGYGSLIWRPGFAHNGAYRARLYGYHRSLCVYSHVHRGTPQRPGLVMGLDRGGSCQGIAYRVDAEQADAVIAYLREREQVTMVYQEQYKRVRLLDPVAGHPTQVQALTYCVDRTHEQYAGALPREDQLEIVRGAKGQSGVNPDYVTQTARALDGMGVRDATLAWLTAQLTA